MTKHNKKRNVGVIHEQLVRYVGSAIIQNDNDSATKAITIQLAEQYMGQFIQVLPEVVSALAPQPGVLGSNPIILAGSNQNGQDAGEATKLVMATSAIALITQMLKNPKLSEWGNKLMDSLSDSRVTAPSNHINEINQEEIKDNFLP